MQTGVCWGLEGCVKAGSAGRMPSLYCRLHMLGMPVQNLTLLKLRTVKFSQFYVHILRLHTKYMKIITILNFPTIHYAAPVDPFTDE